jgi:hypothetical protein
LGHLTGHFQDVNGRFEAVDKGVLGVSNSRDFGDLTGPFQAVNARFAAVDRGVRAVCNPRY